MRNATRRMAYGHRGWDRPRYDDVGYVQLSRDAWRIRRRRRRRAAAGQSALVLLTLTGIALVVLADGLSGGSGLPGGGWLSPGTRSYAPDVPADPGDDGVSPPPDGSVPAVLRANPLYEVGGVADVECPAPPLEEASAAAQRAYDERIFACLNTAWTPLLRAAGAATATPRLFVFDEPGTGPCGSFRPRTGGILAFYCPANQTMYADVLQLANSFPVEDHIVYALVLAHEYGHHVQHASGILQAEGRAAYEQPEREFELSRRTEVQASCFAGMFVRGIEESYPVAGEQRDALAFYAYRAFGDAPDAPPEERTHGSPTTQGRWIETGFTENRTEVCNSYSVPATEVE